MRPFCLFRPEILPDEMKWATSPCLYSLSVYHGASRSHGRTSYGYQRDAIMDLLKGHAPNLTEVEFLDDE
jgi:hypothetical protein